MTLQAIAVNADNIACELIYRLYVNIINKQYGVNCEEYDVSEIAALQQIYASGCEFNDTADCIKIKLYDRGFKCSENANINCSLSLATRSETGCDSLQLTIRN
jgi:hypothetical protein